MPFAVHSLHWHQSRQREECPCNGHAISCVSFHQVLRSPRGLPLCGACMERKRHCRAGWTMRASKLRGSACTICTCDFFRNWGLLLAKPMGCARFTHISMPYWPQCALRASFRMSSTVLKPAGLLVSCKPMMLSLNERICSLRYWSLPAYPSGPTKRDPTFRVARLKVNWAGVFLVGNTAVSKWGFVKGSLGGGDIKPWTSEDGQTCVTMYCHP